MSDLIRRADAMRVLKDDWDASFSREDFERAQICQFHFMKISNIPTAEPIQIETDREKLIKMTYCRGFNDGFEHAQEVISRFVKAVGYNIIIPKDLYDMEES